MPVLIEVKKVAKRCIICPGCNRVVSSAQCDYHCKKWLSLRLKELSFVEMKIKIPVSV